VINLVAKTRFKYKSVIKQGVLRLVSLVSQKEPNKDQSKPGYRVLTYTSKNELYVIDIGKSKKQIPITTDDVGISTAEVDSEEEKMAQPT